MTQRLETPPRPIHRRSDCAVLRLERAAPGHQDDTRRAGKALLDVMRRLVELALVSFRVRSLNGRLHAGFVIESFDATSSLATAGRLRTAATALAPWLSFTVGPFEPDDVLAFPAAPQWASRLRQTAIEDELVRAGDFSPLAISLAATDALLSVSLAPRPDEEGALASDVIIASAHEPTDVLAAILTAELAEGAHLDIQTGHGDAAVDIVSSHGQPEQPLTAALFADVFSLPGRAGTATAWSREPNEPASTATLMEALASAPELHRWIVGRTGTGKTTLLEHLIEADVRAGKTVVAVDPHGDLALRVADAARAAGRAHADRLTIADFGSPDPLTFNPLVGELGQPVGSVVDELIEAMRSMWDDVSPDFFGPVWTRIMRVAVEAVVRYAPQPTFSTLIALLRGDEATREALLAGAVEAGDQRVADGLRTDLRGIGRASSDGAQVSVSLWAIAKLQAFLDDDAMRQIVETTDPSLSLRDIVEHNQVLVVRAPVGVLGTDSVRALSQTILGRLIGTMGRQFELRDRSRPPVALYIDEWALVTERPIQRLLAEGRKYGFELTIAGQSVRQVRDPQRAAANVGTLGLFRVGPAEALLFAPELSRTTAAGLRTLAPYHAVVRTPAGDEVLGRTLPPLPSSTGS